MKTVGRDSDYSQRAVWTLGDFKAHMAKRKQNIGNTDGLEDSILGVLCIREDGSVYFAPIITKRTMKLIQLPDGKVAEGKRPRKTRY